MSTINKLKRNKREFLIGIRHRPEIGNKGLTARGESQARAQRVANGNIARNNFQEENDIAFRNRINAIRNTEELQQIEEGNKRFNEIL